MSGARRPFVGVALATLAALALAASSSPGGAQTADPTVSIDRTGTAAGEEMAITGTGWRPGAVLIVELCGQGGLDGSTDCDVARQRTAGVSAEGRFSTPLRAGVPPTPCPCVVKVTDQESHISATAPIAVQGVPTVPIVEAEAPVRAISITDAVVSGGSWTEWFGAASPRTLELTLQNTGDVTITDPGLTVTWGRGNRPTGFVAVDAVEAMTPGETLIVTVTLPREALSIGRFTAVAELPGLGDEARAEVRDTIVPWGLVALALVVLQLLLLAVRNRLRRRIVDEPSEEIRGDQEPPGSEGAAADVPEEVDLREPTWLDDRRRPRDAEVRPHAPTGADPLLAEHGEAVSLLRSELVRSLESSASRVQHELDAMQQLAHSSVLQTADLTEALVAEAIARSDAVLADAEAQRRGAHRRLSEATDVLREARHEADELVASARAAAREILSAATANGHRTLDVLAELDTRMATIDAAIADIEQRACLLEHQAATASQAAEPAQLLPATTHRPLLRALPELSPARADELDRRLACAFERALGAL